ncbi:class I SAM-dependent DNA methyltransferase [Paenibacillus kobensis]|uniref:class I SAM-dependent DNA methyltransferase n=1 Tax=Paenibacillus kobensis TaxID=59841 RepID=UPI000FDC5FD2|nr:class I SAM-dependent methyltransferase [Paenibacillus kobensis]
MEAMEERYSLYDRYAWFWNKYWGRTFALKTLPVMKQKLLSELPPGALILDVCCGTGQLAQHMTRDGFQFSGIDGSEEMIRLARNNCPAGEFKVGDIRSPFGFPVLFDAACSFFDSLNHITCPNELQAVFININHSLHAGGYFLFDLNMEEGYRQRWNNQTFHIIQNDHVYLDRMNYNDAKQTGVNHITIFMLSNQWERLDIQIVERCYSRDEIIRLLMNAGFSEIEMWEASDAFGLHDEYGRYYIRCRKQAEA